MPKKTVFIFPGTCVKLGMGESLFGDHAEAASLLKKAEAVTGRPLGRLMKTGPLEELQRPLHSLPATFLLSIAVFNILMTKGLRPAVLLGRSVGEIAAATASGAVTFEDGLLLAKARGELFEKVCGGPPGSMAVILGLTTEETGELCRLSERATAGTCEISSINTEDNCVISGHTRSVEKAVALAQSKGARIIPLPLTRPYHSSLMEPAEKEFLAVLSRLAFRKPAFPVVSEPAGALVKTGKEVRDLMAWAQGRCVNWVKRISILKDMEIDRFLEIGPDQGMAVIAAKLLPGSTGRNIGTHADILSLF